MKSVIVIKDGKGKTDKFRVLVCFIQRGINFSNPDNANAEAKKIAKEEHINHLSLYSENT